ncbi:hypothetical protein O7630_08445 [Micromonospora sp. WMMD718]|nr:MULTISPECIES: hypothetical protein [Micromonospora]MDG4750962.1 hypothetical protein [Micromonospora sp. WMMD718]UFN96960.1 hypothetical protein LF814_12870 [Micromonospora aurantiaca]
MGEHTRAVPAAAAAHSGNAPPWTTRTITSVRTRTGGSPTSVSTAVSTTT